MTTIPDLPAGAPRVRPWVRRTSIAAFAMLLPLAAHQAWDYVEVQRLVAELRAIEARGEPISDSQPNWPGPRDAGTYYAAAALVGFDSTGEVVPPVERIGDLLDAATLDRAAIAAEGSRLERVTATYAEALHLADTAASLGYAGPPRLLQPLVPGLGQSIARLIAARSIDLAFKDRGDEALASVDSGVHARRAIHEAWFSGGAREVAAVLSLSTPTAPALQRTQAALEAVDRPDRDVERFLRGRARYIQDGWIGPATPRLLASRSTAAGVWLWRPFVTDQAVATLRAWANLADIVRLPWPQRFQAAAAFHAEQESSFNHRWPGRLFVLLVHVMPTAPLFADFMAVTTPKPLTIDRCARIALAIERYRRDRGGQMPEKLSALVPSYLATIPSDPYSGRPLLLRSTPAGYTIYSVGDDGRDDGGDLSSVQARVLPDGRRLVTKGRDLGLRVWLP